MSRSAFLGGKEPPRGTRALAWPPPAGSDPAAVLAELAAAIDALNEGEALVLVEFGEAEGPAALDLCERLATHWEGAGRRTLVVDAHPLAPLFSLPTAASPEGLTEILHYGLSPAAAASERPGCAGLWIAGGGHWALPLESPEEPDRSLARLLGEADRVLLLADAGDAEGLLGALRARVHFRLDLAPSAPERAAPARVEAAPPLRELPPRVAAPAPQAAAPLPRWRARRWPLLLYPAGALLLALGIILIRGAWRGGPGPGRSIERGTGESFSPLPTSAELPYRAAHPVAESLEAAPPGAAEDERPQRTAAQDAPPAAPAGMRAATLGALPAAESTPRRAAAPTAAPGPQRRFEPQASWSRLLGAPGPFYVHLESFRDSVRAAEAVGTPAARRVGARLAPATVEGTRWYRLWLGPFADLDAAAACRDSLLDRAGEDYCRIVTPTP